MVICSRPTKTMQAACEVGDKSANPEGKETPGISGFAIASALGHMGCVQGGHVFRRPPIYPPDVDSIIPPSLQLQPKRCER